MRKIIIKHAIVFFTIFIITNIPFVFAAGGTKGKELYNAVLFQDIPKINSLIAAGADVNYKEKGRPILGWAAQNGNAEVVSLLLKGGADPNAKDDGVGHTALMRAIDTRQIGIVKAILETKVDPNIKTPDGSTALTMAIERKLPEIVQALIAAGAKTEGDFGEIDPPVLLAAQSGLPEGVKMIKALAKAGADMNVSNTYYTPLSYAVEQGNEELVAALLEAGANPNAKGKSDRYPLELTLDKPAVLAALLKAKADPNIKFDDDTTPLVRAVFSSNVEAVKLLVVAGADKELPDAYGSTPLEIAGRNNNSEIIALLESPVDENSNAQSSIGAGSPADSDEVHAKLNKGNSKDCTVVDASRKHMEVYEKLEEKVNTGKMSSDIFIKFKEDTKDYPKFMTEDPPAACQLLDSVAVKYGVK